MAALVAGIYVLKLGAGQDVDGRNKSSRDERAVLSEQIARRLISKGCIEQELDVERHDRGGDDP